MSPENRKKGITPFVPPNPPKEQPPTASEVQNLMQLFTDFHQTLLRANTDQADRFKQLFDDSHLKKYIVMAGVSGVILATIEVVRLIAQAYSFASQHFH